MTDNAETGRVGRHIVGIFASDDEVHVAEYVEEIHQDRGRQKTIPVGSPEELEEVFNDIVTNLPSVFFSGTSGAAGYLTVLDAAEAAGYELTYLTSREVFKDFYRAGCDDQQLIDVAAKFVAIELCINESEAFPGQYLATRVAVAGKSKMDRDKLRGSIPAFCSPISPKEGYERRPGAGLRKSSEYTVLKGIRSRANDIRP